MRRRGRLVRRTLPAADLVAILASFGLAAWISSGPTAGASDGLGSRSALAVLVLTLPLWILAGAVYDLYGREESSADHSASDETVAVFSMVTVGIVGFAGMAWLTGLAEIGVASLLLFWAVCVVCVPLIRVTARLLSRRSDAFLQNTVILGQGAVGRRVARKLQQHPEYRVNVLGFVDDQGHATSDGPGPGSGARPVSDTDEPLPVLGDHEELASLVDRLDVERVIVAFPDAPDESTLDTVRDLSALGLQVDVVPRMFELLGPEVRMHGVEGLALLGLPNTHLSRSALILKRALDLVVATAGVVVLSPVLVAIAIAVKLDSPGPVLFRQERMGHRGRTFTILKFRTMASDAEARKGAVAHLNQHADGDARMFKIPDDPRTTRVGRILRRWSLDELPQLVNVITGHMSLVGPRPLILAEDAHVDGWGRRRLDLKPGITGLWQVLGRDGIPFGEMLDLDYRYITGWSLRNDLKLIFRTLPALLRARHG